MPFHCPSEMVFNMTIIISVFLVSLVVVLLNYIRSFCNMCSPVNYECFIHKFEMSQVKWLSALSLSQVKWLSALSQIKIIIGVPVKVIYLHDTVCLSVILVLFSFS